MINLLILLAIFFVSCSNQVLYRTNVLKEFQKFEDYYREGVVKSYLITQNGGTHHSHVSYSHSLKSFSTSPYEIKTLGIQIYSLEKLDQIVRKLDSQNYNFLSPHRKEFIIHYLPADNKFSKSKGHFHIDIRNQSFADFIIFKDGQLEFISILSNEPKHKSACFEEYVVNRYGFGIDVIQAVAMTRVARGVTEKDIIVENNSLPYLTEQLLRREGYNIHYGKIDCNLLVGIISKDKEEATIFSDNRFSPSLKFELH